MKEHPILFSGPMVLAILAGTKTQTRRLMRPQPEPIPGDVERVKGYDDSGFWWASDKCRSMVSLHDAPCLSPYGYKRDRLWVRESFCENYFGDAQPGTLKRGYKSDWSAKASDVCPEPRWTPSIHMPRWASRIALEVTEVRVQRLQDLSEEDAKAEGVEPLSGVHHDQPLAGEARRRTHGTHPHTLAFAVLWDTINGSKAPWSSNPWVWAISFRRLP